MKKITLYGHIVVQPEELDTIKKALPVHLEATRAEEGCITFQVDEHPTEAGRFDVYEEFVSKSAFEHHQKRVKESAWGAATQNVSRSYTVEGLES
ncbi:putative quinol monooxygenase [Rubritalea sp.]|uniref:putative quinol monooxygenase n=1 Tax=Rubritalea sp. TaxID=2109375 RepID=UPI003EF3DA32